MTKNEQRFVLLDRDGTVIIDQHYLSNYRQVKLLPGAAEGLKRMQSIGLRIAIITNQSGVGRNYFKLDELDLIHKRMIELLDMEGIKVDGIFFCPHTPEDGCNCRKPNVGLINQASSSLNFDPGEAIIIGDKACDIELGKNVNATTILVRTGGGSKTEKGLHANPDYIVDDLIEASTVINMIIKKCN